MTTRQASRYGIPCPSRLNHLKELLPASAPIRLACTQQVDKFGIEYIAYPQHCFSLEKETRSTFIEKFWETVEPLIRHDTVCVIRQHGRQTVLQLNI